MILIRLILSAIAALMALSAWAGDVMPANWPWRGVTLDYRAEVPDLQRLKKRLPELNQIRVTLKPQKYRADYHRMTGQEALDRLLTDAAILLDECRELGIVAVLSMSDFPLDGSIDKSEPSFWRDYRQEVIDTAGVMAAIFADHPAVVAYELISEPYQRDWYGNKEQPDGWLALQLAVLQAIRRYSGEQWLVTNPGFGGVDAYEDFQPLSDDKIVYGFHFYKHIKYTHQSADGHPWPYPGWIKDSFWNHHSIRASMRHVRDFQERHEVPVWMGEFSTKVYAPNAARWLTDVADAAKRNHFGWSYHSYGGAKDWNPDYDSGRIYRGDRTERWDTLREIFK